MSIIGGARAALGSSWIAAAAPCPVCASGSSSSCTSSSSSSPFLQYTLRSSRGHLSPTSRSIQLARWLVCGLDGAAEQPLRSASREGGGEQSEGLKKRRLRAAPSSSVLQSCPGVEGEDIQATIAADTDPNSITEWELDFCSRPILDERGKKLWELVVCDSKRRVQFSQFFPNNVINSITLRDAIVYIMETLGLPKPQKIRFFRSQMQIIVSKACSELDIQPVPSQRCITLIRWLEERYDSVYRHHPGFQESATPLLQLEQSLPLELPDTLRGEQWAFVQLPLSGVLEEAASVEQGSTFGSVLALDTLGLQLPLNAVIPGVAVASSRATPLAAWTNALELGSLEVDKQRACVVLSTGVSDRWLYAYYRKSRQADQEAEAWESTKRACGGLHFLAVQQSLDSEICNGFWLLFDSPRSRV